MTETIAEKMHKLFSSYIENDAVLVEQIKTLGDEGKQLMSRRPIHMIDDMTVSFDRDRSRRG